MVTEKSKGITSFKKWGYEKLVKKYGFNMEKIPQEHKQVFAAILTNMHINGQTPSYKNMHEKFGNYNINNRTFFEHLANAEFVYMLYQHTKPKTLQNWKEILGV